MVPPVLSVRLGPVARLLRHSDMDALRSLGLLRADRRVWGRPADIGVALAFL